ncbi:MAG: hypothetical protein ACR2H3_01925 [Acidimicrobiales bacterium]
MTRFRPALAAIALVGVYLVIAWLGDTRAWSGADAGGKAATAVHMVAVDSWTPDVGYWAEEWDPTGLHHPLYNTLRVGDRWVQATSVPFALASRAGLGRLGVGGLLVLPMLGSVVAALAASSLARTLGATSGAAAFWVVGLGTPVGFYAIDAWEHAPALGLAMLAVAMATAIDVRPTTSSQRSELAGVAAAAVAAGAAVVFRAEMAVYLGAFSAALLVIGRYRRAWLRPRRLATAAAGLAAPIVANELLERAVLGVSVRSDRAASLTTGAGSAFSGRARDAVLTSVGVFADTTAASFGLGALGAAALIVLGYWAIHGRPPLLVLSRGVLACGALVAVTMATAGLGFVPGWLPAAPLAAAGLWAVDRRGDESRVVLVVVAAVLALPGVWMTSHVGLLSAQWGGRYVLLTGVLLSVAGVVALERVGWRRPASLALLAVTAAMSVFGAAWHIERTREVGEFSAEVIRATPADAVVVSRWGQLGREAGAFYDDRRWLTAITDDDARDALQIARRAGARQVVMIELPESTLVVPAGWEERSAEAHRVLGAEVVLRHLTR